MLRVEQLQIGSMPPLTFSVPAGECLAVEGPSGIGKSRLLRAIADLDPADGYVYLNGKERLEMPADRWRAKVRYIAAEPGWWADTAREHMPEAPEIEALAAELGLAEKTLDQPISELSTGERLRLALIRALADDPEVLLLDEPTAALDEVSARRVEALIRGEIDSGCRVVLVSHNIGEIERLAHQRLMLAVPKAAEARLGART